MMCRAGSKPNGSTFSGTLGPLQVMPGGACQSPHWGYVIAGRMRFVFDDREEVYEGGDAFYTPPGHRPYVDAGTELLQFSPTKELAELERATAEWMSKQTTAS